MAYQPKSYRKYLAGAAAAAVVTSALPAAGFAAAFTDSIPAWAKDAVNYLVEKGAIQGYPDGTYQPSKAITRGEAAAILAETLGLEIDETAKTTFADAKDHWASAAIAALQAQKEGVINGYEDGSFKPNNKITRQEMAKMVVEAYGLELDADQDVDFSDNNGWGKEFVNILASLGVVQGQGEGKFAPTANVTRAETAVFVHRAEVPGVRETPSADDQSIKNVTVLSEDGRYLAVEFAKAVGSVDKSEFTIAKTNGERVGIESVSVSPDGKTVELVVYDADAKDEIEAGVEYTVTYKGNGETLSFTFERPNYLDDRQDARVTEVDADNKDFTVSYDDGTATGGSETIEVPEGVEFDYEAAVGAEIRVWFTGDNKLIKYEIANEDKVLYDAFEVDLADKTIELKTAGKEYDLSTNATNNIAIDYYVNGKKEADMSKLADAEYAKVILNDKGDVAYIRAYTFTDMTVVESVKGTQVEGLGDSDIDLEDYVIVKDGKTISVTDLEAGDALYYNQSADNSIGEKGYAVVYNNKITGNIETIYDDSFVVEGKKYKYSTMSFIDEDGERVDSFAKSDAEDFEAEEVTIYVDYNKNVQLLTGVQGQGNTVKALTTATPKVYADVKKELAIELEYVTEELEEELVDLYFKNLDSIKVDGKKYDLEQDTAENKDYVVKATANENEFAIYENKTTDVFVKTVVLADNNPISFEVDEDGTITDLEIITTVDTLKEDVEPGDSNANLKTDGAKKLLKDTLVFVAEDGAATDAEDVEVYQFADITFDIEKDDNNNATLDAQVFYNEDGDVEFIVVPDTVAADTTEHIAVVDSFSTNSGDVTRLVAFVNGVKTTYTVDKLKGINTNLLKDGQVVKIEVNDEDGVVENIFTPGNADEFSADYFLLNQTSATSITSNKFTLGTTEYQKGDNFQIIDATDRGDLDTETSLSSLAGKKFHVILDGEKSRYVSAIVIIGEATVGNDNGYAPGFDTTAPNAVTGLAFTDTDLDAGQVAGEVIFTASTSTDVASTKVFLGTTEVAKDAAGKYTVAENTAFTAGTQIKVVVTDYAGLVAETTLAVADLPAVTPAP